MKCYLKCYYFDLIVKIYMKLMNFLVHLFLHYLFILLFLFVVQCLFQLLMMVFVIFEVCVKQHQIRIRIFFYFSFIKQNSHLVCMTLLNEVKFRIYIDVGMDNEIKHQENESLEHRDALEQLSDKIDQLVIVLDKVFII